jgi:hypothetical protein
MSSTFFKIVAQSILTSHSKALRLPNALRVLLRLLNQGDFCNHASERNVRFCFVKFSNSLVSN